MGRGGWYAGTHGTLSSPPQVPLTSRFPSKLQPLALPNPGRATLWTLGCCAVPGAWPPSPGSAPSVPWNKVSGLESVPDGEGAPQAAREQGRPPTPQSPLPGEALPRPSESFHCPYLHGGLPACAVSPGLAQGAQERGTGMTKFPSPHNLPLIA